MPTILSPLSRLTGMLLRSKAQSLTQDTARAELRAGIEDVRFWPDAERGCAAWWAARVRFLLAERDTISETGKAIWAICQEYGIKHKPFCSMASSEEESTEACDCGLVEKVFTALKGEQDSVTPREALEDAREALLKAYREGSESHHHALWVEIYADSLVSIAEAAEAYLRTGEAVELAMLRAAIGHLRRD